MQQSEFLGLKSTENERRCSQQICLQCRLWLQKKAQGGDLDALAKLRAQNAGPERKASAVDRIISAVGVNRDARDLPDQQEPEWRRLRYTVAENGDVTYFRDRKELIVDSGRRLFVVDISEATVESGLRLAAQKWGGKMNLSGTDEFIRQAIEVAAHKNMQIEFVDPAHSEQLQDLKKKIRAGMQHIAKHRENIVAPTEEVQTHEKKEEAEEVMNPSKRAARQPQQNRTQQVAQQEKEEGGERDRDIDLTR